MKRCIAIIMAVLMIGCVTACTKKTVVNTEEFDLVGTWKVEGIEYEGSMFTVEEWETVEYDDYSEVYIIFKDGGKAYVYDGYGDLVNWIQSENTIMIDGDVATIVDDNICYEYYGDKLYFKKVSDNQEIPKEPSEEEYEEEEENVTTTITTTTIAPTTTQTTVSTEDSDELRSEFVEAMDSYEAFMNEYVDFMKKYNENPSDLSLLSEYATFMKDYAQFVEDFEKWEDEDMNAAELAYYIEVQTRVTTKLLEISY